jgi:hypothetical protein
LLLKIETPSLKERKSQNNQIQENQTSVSSQHGITFLGKMLRT